MTLEAPTKTAITTDAATLLTALDTTLVFAAKDESRAVLQAVRIESTESVSTFVSADGHHMGIVDLADSIGELDTLIHTDSVKAIVKMLKSVGKHQRERVTVTLDSERFDIPNVGTIPVTVVAGTFPDWRRLIPEVETQVSRTDKFAVDSSLLLKAATVASRYADKATMRFTTPPDHKSPIMATWEINGSMSARYVLMPMLVQWGGESAD